MIDILPEQRSVSDKGATMRLGAYKAMLKEGSLVRKLYGNAPQVYERHRHRYEVNPGLPLQDTREGHGVQRHEP